MANKRMISLSFVLSDSFMELSIKEKTLYFYLIFSADDDGIVSNAQSVARSLHLYNSSVAVLVEKGYLIKLDGVYAITDWLKHNNIRSDRYTPTVFKSQFSRLTLDASGAYRLREKGEPAVIRPTSTSAPSSFSAQTKRRRRDVNDYCQHDYTKEQLNSVFLNMDDIEVKDNELD